SSSSSQHLSPFDYPPDWTHSWKDFTSLTSFEFIHPNPHPVTDLSAHPPPFPSFSSSSSSSSSPPSPSFSPSYSTNPSTLFPSLEFNRSNLNPGTDRKAHLPPFHGV